MRYACLIHCDPKLVFDQNAQPNEVLAQVGRHDAELRASGTCSQPMP